jgi:diguanylate cyclase (GGDEF)-like protein
MRQLFFQFFTRVPASDIENFKQQKFNQNNNMIRVIAAFLIFEQVFYGLFISEKGSLLQKIYFCSALLMLIYFLISTYFYYNKPEYITILHIVYELSIAFIGLMVAIIRIIFIQREIFHLPTVYIAVIYALALIFYYSYKESFLIYTSAAFILIVLLSIYRPSLQFNHYIADIISNSLIAWIASMVNYQKYIREFNNVQIIEQKNKILKKKNIKIKAINDKLHNISITDELTGIYNRRKIENVLKRVFAESERYNKEFSVILCDLDFFKRINDNFGHLIGDEVLKKVSNLLTENIRYVDICGRWGGEEFLIICPETDINSACNLAIRLRDLIENSTFKHKERLTVSFGVTSYLYQEEIRNLIKRVDENLYQAKRKGRNIVICS